MPLHPSGRTLAAAAALLTVSVGVVSPAQAAGTGDPVAPVAAQDPASALTFRTAAGQVVQAAALPLEVDTDGDGRRDTLAYRLGMDPGLQTGAPRSVTVVPGAAAPATARTALGTATRAQRLDLARQVHPDLDGLSPAQVDQVVAQAAQAAIWRSTLGATPVRPYAEAAPAATAEQLVSLHEAVYAALLSAPHAGQGADVLRVDVPGQAPAALVVARRFAPVTRTATPTPTTTRPAEAPSPTPTEPTPTEPTATRTTTATPTAPVATSPVGATPGATATSSQVTPAPTSASPAPTTPTATTRPAEAPSPTPSTPSPSATTTPSPSRSVTPSPSAPTSPAPAPTTPAPSASAAAPVVLPPASAALQPARADQAPAPVAIVLPGTKEQRRVLALPYALDLDRDSTRETTGFVMEPDVAVPTSPTVVLDQTPEWSSSSSPTAVPDPARWEAVQDRVAALTAAAADPRSRADLLRRAGLDLADQPADEVDRLVQQATQLAVWRISSGVRPAPGFRYAADPATPVNGDRAVLGDAFATLLHRLVSDPALTPHATATVYRVRPVATGARPTGGRSLARGTGTRAPSLVVGRPGSPLRAAPALRAEPQAAPAPAAEAPAADGSSCQALGRSDVARSDADYRAALDRDGDGMACESNGQDGPVSLGPGAYVDSRASVPSSATPSAGPTQPTSVLVQSTGPTPAPAPVTVGAPTCSDYQARGAGPIPASDPRYRPELDSDSDGIGCEANEGSSSAPGTQLAHTGAEVAWLTAGGVGMVVLGVALVSIGWNRRERLAVRTA